MTYIHENGNLNRVSGLKINIAPLLIQNTIRVFTVLYVTLNIKLCLDFFQARYISSTLMIIKITKMDRLSVVSMKQLLYYTISRIKRGQLNIELWIYYKTLSIKSSNCSFTFQSIYYRRYDGCLYYYKQLIPLE